MRTLFIIDKKNYIENGSVGRRPSVRGIIIREGKLAMIYSKKYEYYKLLGGGIEPGETYEDTLIREVKEEGGLTVKKDTIKEFGIVHRIERGKIEDIFIQDNYYYLCEVEDEITDQNLDDKEVAEEFVLKFEDPKLALTTNETACHKGKETIQTFSGMLERENRVLRIVIDEILN